MKRTISLLTAAVLLFLCGCAPTLPINSSFTAAQESSTEAAAESTVSQPTQTQPTQTQPTQTHTIPAQTQPATEKPTVATPTSTAPTSAATQATQKPTELIDELISRADALLGEPATWSSPDPDKPMIALTFDDGPSAHTDRLLDCFKANGGKGTFFVVGNIIDRRKDTLRRIVNEGHELGNHSWSHADLTTLSESEIALQIAKTNTKIFEVTGYSCAIVRPPYGAYNNAVKAVGKKMGISYIMWSVDTLDWKSKNADAVYKAVMSSAKDGAIILLHDLHKTTVDAMERAIPELTAQGYQLVTVSQLLTAGGQSLEAGKTYNKLK